MAHGAVRQAVASFDQLMEVFQQGVQWRKLGELLACCLLHDGGVPIGLGLPCNWHGCGWRQRQGPLPVPLLTH